MTEQLTIAEVEQQFAAALAEAELGDHYIPADGDWHTFAFPDEYSNKQSGSARLTVTDDEVDGVVFDHRESSSRPLLTWSPGAVSVEAGSGRPRRTPEEVAALRAAQAAARAERVQELRREFYDLPAAPADHPYLVRKKITDPTPIRVRDGDVLCVPIFNARNGDFQGYQRIFPDGGKKNQQGASQKGGCVMPGEVDLRRLKDSIHPRDHDTPVVIGEGFATCYAVKVAKFAIKGALSLGPVVSAFTADNLIEAAKALRDRFPLQPFLFFADNDADGKGLAGAEAAAAAAGDARVVASPDGYKDFNDLFVTEGGVERIAAVIAPVLAEMRGWERTSDGDFGPTEPEAKTEDVKRETKPDDDDAGQEAKSDQRSDGGPSEADIPAETMAIIHEGAPPSEKPALAFWSVVAALKRVGFTVDGVVALLERYPDGIAKEFRGRLRQATAYAYAKVDANQESESNETKTDYKGAIDTLKHGEAPPAPGPQLIRNRLPAVGKGLLSGQSSTFKTFVFIDLAIAVMAGGTWLGEPVYRQGGVLFFAVEGGSGVALRLAAAVQRTLPNYLGSHATLPDGFPQPKPVDPKRLPFEWAVTCPPILGRIDPLPALEATAKRAHDRFMREFGLPLVMIGFDTMAVAAQMKDENENAEAAKLWAIMEKLCKRTNTVVIGVDHVGKDAERGTRGASAKEDNVDFVLMTLGKKSLEGRVEDPRLVLRKLKEGPQSDEFPFNALFVNMGQDEYGFDVTSRVIHWTGVRASRPQARRRDPEHVRLFHRALAEAIAAHGATVSVDGQEMRVATIDKVQEAFERMYDAQNPGDAQRKNRRQAWYRAKKWLHEEAQDVKFDEAGRVWHAPA